MNDHAISTTPKGHAPARNPYALDKRHPMAKPAMYRRPRRSRAYIIIMNETAASP